MKYLDKSFSTPANSRAYVEGWERCFGEEPVDVKPDEEVVVEVTEEGSRVVVNE